MIKMAARLDAQALSSSSDSQKAMQAPPTIAKLTPTTTIRQYIGSDLPDKGSEIQGRRIVQLEKTPDGSLLGRRSTGRNVSFSKRPQPRLPPACPLKYEQPHLGDPCTFRCLDHLLGCGHKIFTTEPEPCALNCHSRVVPDYSQPRDLDSSFTCLACVLDHLHVRRAMRLSAFVEEVQERASLNNWPASYIAEKVEHMAPGWRDDDLREMKMLLKNGRPSGAFWIEPEFQVLVDAIEEARGQRTCHAGSIYSSASVDSAVQPDPPKRNGHRSASSIISLFSSPSKKESKLPQLPETVHGLFSQRETARDPQSQSQS